MAQIWRKGFPRGRETLNCGQGTQGEGQPFAEVSILEEGGREPISQPSYLVLR